MEIDLIGRLNKIKLPVTNAMNPLFEAIINSIHAIEEIGGKGQIDIFIGARKHKRLSRMRILLLHPARLAVSSCETPGSDSRGRTLMRFQPPILL